MTLPSVKRDERKYLSREKLDIMSNDHQIVSTKVGKERDNLKAINFMKV